MLLPEPVEKVTILGPKTKMRKIVDELYAMDMFHIIDHHKSKEVDTGDPFDQNENYAEILIKIRSLISFLEINCNGTKKNKDSLNSIKEKTDEIHEQVNGPRELLKYLQGVIEIYKKEKQQDVLKSLPLTLPDQDKHKSMVHFIGFVKDDIEKELQEITSNYSLFTSSFQRVPTLGVFVRKKYAKKVGSLLKEHNFYPIEDAHINKTYDALPSESGPKLRKENFYIKRIGKRIEELKRILNKIAEREKSFLCSSEKRLAEECEKAESPLRFAATEHLFMVKGWVPRKMKAQFKSRLEKITDHHIYVAFEKKKKGDKVPILLDHPKLVEPFRFFLDLYTLPKYTELDPTFFVFLTFPFFFGFMLGDIGYGFLTLTLFYLLRKKMPKARQLLNVMMLSSLVTILFGIAYGEFFGEEELFGMQLPHIISRSNAMNELLVISVIIGLIHINFGLILGFINKYRQHGLGDAVFEKGCWFTLELGTLLVVISRYGIAIPSIIGKLILLLGVGMLIKGEGFKGLLEIPSLFSNILSYARLMAVGIASVSLAVVTNEFAKDAFHGGIIGIFGGILLLLIGHTINVALGIIGPFLHSLRLHYVEFFTKFFEGGGIPFRSFGKSR